MTHAKTHIVANILVDRFREPKHTGIKQTKYAGAALAS